ncbi:hypothetical protein AWC38_SpisGene18591 [Stylophora pistillata]|uniref:Rho termination factor-like N-terminal domain-containing protein n=1 Tax=Stylophora pistillata TaxID=50429 RepID=A0A2B4RIU2_STYPI|nr:hypothetical protein AWC38_SpisGene18591 [Stylophora pistillata]
MDKPRWVYKMDELEIYTKAALLAKGKEMGLKGLTGLNKKDLMEVIKNPAQHIAGAKKDSKAELLMKAKEMGLQGLYKLKKKDLIEVIKNPPPPCARHCGVRKKVILTPVDSSEELVFPSIYKASQHFNINPGRIHICIMERHTVEQLRKLAKKNGLHGYSRLRKAELIRLIQSSSAAASSAAVSKPQKQYPKIVFVWNHSGGSLLDAPIPTHEIPKGDILKPTPAPLIKKIEKVVDWGKKKVEDWGQWLKDVSNTPRAAVDDKLKDFKQYINQLYKKDDHRFKLVERASSLKQFTKTHTIDGVDGYGPKGFLVAVKPTVINFLNAQKNIKIEFIFRCEMIKKDIITGEVETMIAYFSSHQKIIFRETDGEELYEESVHNLANYDAHLFVRNLGVSEGEIDCIPNNEEKYISFTKHVVVDKFFNKKEEKDVEVKRELRFIDSFKFMASSLDELVKNLAKKGRPFFKNTGRYYSGEKLKLLMRKGVYPYEWMDSIHKLDEPQLPPKEAFFSKLSGRGISKKDYTHAQKVWRVFECKTFRDYHNLYNSSDVLLLADVFERMFGKRGKEKKKCKGTKKSVVQSTISFANYKKCLFGGEKQLRKMNTLRSRKHEMYMEEINKVALSADDDKRIILPDKIHTYAIGHCREADNTTG